VENPAQLTGKEVERPMRSDGGFVSKWYKKVSLMEIAAKKMYE
jgi:hypothetical protein